MLASTERGSGGPGLPVVLVHGFTQTSETWDELLTHLHPGRKYIAVDLPGHGRSAEVDADVPEAARLLGKVARGAHYIGYSLGGRVCLQLAVSAPERVGSLVLIGASPGIADPQERADRRIADEELARSMEADGVETFLRRWLEQSIFAGLAGRIDQEVERRSVNSPEGLTRSLRMMGTGSMDPMWEVLPGVKCPVLVIAGENDIKFRQIGKAMATRMPTASYYEIPGAGHAVHLEQPETTAAAIEAFLGDHGSPSVTS